MNEKLDRFLVCNRAQFSLELYVRPENQLKFRQPLTYRISVGADGFNTPEGLHLISSRSKNPSWTIPNSPWVEEERRGLVIESDDPENPIKARWLGISDGVGIHGTDDEGSIGKAASHGCIRMRIDNVIDLYDRIPLYTPIYII